MKKSEEPWFMNGAKYFGKEYNTLTNKEQYKEERMLNTGLMNFREKKPIIIYTKCIASTEYLYRVFPEHRNLHDVRIYYMETKVKIETLNDHYQNNNISFHKINFNPKDIVDVNTIVFASDDTVIYDDKLLGLVGKGKERLVYRNKSKSDFSLVLEKIKSFEISTR